MAHSGERSGSRGRGVGRSIPTVLVTYGGMALSVVSAPLLARELGADGKGALASVTASLQLLGWVTPLGLPTGTAIRIVKRSEHSSLALRVIGALGILAAGLAVLLAPVVANGNAVVESGLRIGSISLVFCGIGGLGTQISLLEGRIVLYNLVRACTLVFPSFATIVLWLLGLLSFESALGVTLIGIMLAYGIAIVGVWSKLTTRGPAGVPWRLSLGLWTTSAFDSIAARLDIVALSAVASSSIVGVYSVAVTCASVAGGFAQAINVQASSQFIDEARGGSRYSLRRVALASGVITLVASVAVCIGVWTFGTAVFGPDFAGLTPIVAVLCIGQWLQYEWQLVVARESAFERAHDLFRVSMAASIAYLGFICLLFVLFGPTALAMAFAYTAFCGSRLGIYSMVRRHART